MAKTRKPGPMILAGLVLCAALFCPLSQASALAPYFDYCTVKSDNATGGMNTVITARVQHPGGPAPGLIASITVEGPGGFNQVMTPADYVSGLGDFTFSKRFTGAPAAGQYTFTVLDNFGESATSYYYLAKVASLPVVDASTLRAFGDMTTPTLTWSDFPSYNGNLLFRVRIFDSNDNIVWNSDLTGITSITVPSSFLASGQAYTWRVFTYDNIKPETSDNRSTSDAVPLAPAAGPGFQYSRVYRVDPSGAATYTFFSIQVSTPASATIASLTVQGPGGSVIHSFTQADYNGSSYSYQVAGAPADGIYTFTTMDSNEDVATSYHYFENNPVPSANESTLQASGADLLAPRLTWAAPNPGSSTSPLFYTVNIYDKADGSTVWSSSGMTSTSCAVPSGYLLSGHNYQWRLYVQDVRWPYRANNYARTNLVDLVLDNSKPNFYWGADVDLWNTPSGISTQLQAYVNDPSTGGGLSPQMTLAVSGPGGFSHQIDAASVWADPTGGYEYWYFPSGVLPDGSYTFTLTYPGGQIVTYDALHNTGQVPIADESSFQVTGDPATPTVNWSAIAGYPGHLYYRIRVDDASGATVYLSSRGPSTAQTVPAGVLQPGQSYKYRVEAFDDPAWIVLNNRSVSNYHPLELTQVATPAFDPGGGTYSSELTVTISCATIGATIRYTTDGTDPASSSALYDGPVIISTSTILKARAFNTGMADSAVGTASYTIAAGFLSIGGGAGDPLTIYANDYGTMGVDLSMGTIPVAQYSGGVEGIGTTLFFDHGASDPPFYCDAPVHGFQGYTWAGELFTPVSHQVLENGSIETVMDVGTTGLRITLTITYTPGARKYTKAMKITNTSSTRTFTNLKLLHGGDTTFAGIEASVGHWDAATGTVYLTNPKVPGSMRFHGGQTSPATHYFAGYYDEVWYQMGQGQLPDTVNGTLVDAGYALQWNWASIAPGETVSGDAEEEWTNTDYVSVISPGDQNGLPGDPVPGSFFVTNYTEQARDFNLSLTLSDTTGGWAGDLPAGSALTLNPGESAAVDATVSIPSTAALGSANTATLTVASQTAPTMTGSDSFQVIAAGAVAATYLPGDTNFDHTLTAEDYQLVGVPGVDPYQKDPLKVFGPAGAVYGNDIRIFQYENGVYKEYNPAAPPSGSISPVAPHEGYFVILGQQNYVEVFGDAVPDTAYTITLQPGWNLVAAPFVSGSALDYCTVNGTALLDAAQTLVQHDVWGYSVGYYNVLDVGGGALEPWRSYWMKNLTSAPVNIVLSPNPIFAARTAGASSRTAVARSQSGASAKKVAAAKTLAGAVAPKAPAVQKTPARTGLAFTLNEKSKAYKDRTLFLGMRPRSKAGADSMDSLAPPPIAANVPRVYVDHNDWSVRPGKYAVDTRPAGVPTSYALTVEVPYRETAVRYVLTWKGQLTIAKKMNIGLRDSLRRTMINMRTRSAYEFVVPKHTKTYKLSVLIMPAS
jgi:hypothetical protein